MRLCVGRLLGSWNRAKANAAPRCNHWDKARGCVFVKQALHTQRQAHIHADSTSKRCADARCKARGQMVKRCLTAMQEGPRGREYKEGRKREGKAVAALAHQCGEKRVPSLVRASQDARAMGSANRYRCLNNTSMRPPPLPTLTPTHTPKLPSS